MNATRLLARLLSRPGVRRGLAGGLAGAALVLTGCAGHYYPLRDMTAEQIKAATSSRETAATCIHATYGPADATTVIINSDKGVPGGVTFKPNCETVFDTRPQLPPGQTTVPVQLQVVPR